MARILVGDDFSFSDPMGLMPATKAPEPTRRSNWSRDDIRRGIIETAEDLGVDPVDVATAISYETGGTFDPVKGGPHTKYGRHRGLIQFGEPQAAQYGVDWSNPVGSQLGRGGAVSKYLRAAGVRPGMGLLDIYSAINAGRVGHYGASDAAAGGAPGTVRDKVQGQMAGHRRKALALLGANGDVDTMTTAGTSSGNGANRIVIDDEQGFQPSDPMGLFAGQQNPLARTAAPPPEELETEPAEQPGLPDLKLEELNRENPGQWTKIPANQFEQWRQRWEADQPGVIGDLYNAFKIGMQEGNVQSSGATLQALGDALDAPSLTEAGKSIKEYGKSGTAGVRAPRITDIAQVGSLDDFAHYVAATLGSAAASTVPSLIGGAAGSVAGGAAGTVVAGPAGTAVGGALGMLAGAGGPSYVLNAGDMYQSIIDDPAIQAKIKSGELTRKGVAQIALAGAVPVAALDMYGVGEMFKIGAKGFKGELYKRIAKGIATGAITEGTTEGLQQVIQEGVQDLSGGSKSLGEQANSVINASLGGALFGGVAGAPGGAMSKEATEGGTDTTEQPPPTAPAAPTAPPVAPVKEPPKAGPLTEAVKHAERRTTEKVGGEFVINDPPMAGPEGEQLPAGPMHGTTVQLDPDQGGVNENMRRVVLPDGQKTLIGVRNLQPKSVAEQPAQVQQEAGAIPAGAPALRAGVTVNVPGGKSFPAMIDSYSPEGEAIVADQDGEIYQVPLDAIGVAPAPRAREGVEPEAAPDEPAGIPLEKLPAAPPRAAETKTTLPPAEAQKPALQRFPGPPEAGQSVIVDAPQIGERFAGRVQSYEGDEALVRRPDGTEIQVPLTALFVDKRQPKEIEAEEQKLRPPAEREKPAPSPTRRSVTVAKGQSRTVQMPDELHSRLYDLGQMRQQALRMQGVSRLELDRVNPSEQEAIARDLHISPEAAGQIADDYRYRVERAAKQARSELPQKVQRINPELLKRRQSEFARAAEPNPEAAPAVPAGEAAAVSPATAAAAPATPIRDWWDSGLTWTGRKRVLDRAGVKRSPKTLWQHFPINLQSKIAAVRPAMDAEFAAEAEPAAPATPVDVHAHEAASSPQNELKPPTPAQQAAENFKMGHVRLAGLEISIKHPEGAERSGTAPGGKVWKRKLKSHYGHILGTLGGDEDRIDVFIKPGTVPEEVTDETPIVVVDQRKPSTHRFDEHKVMIGYGSEEEARQAYLENYPKGWEKTGVQAVTPTTMGEFKRWLGSADTLTEPFAVRGLKPPIEKPTAPADLSPLQKRASDVYSRVWDQAVAKPTDRQQYRNWWEQIAELIVNPSRFHPVVEEENPQGLKIGDEATIEGKSGLVASIATQGIYQGALLVNPEGSAVWRTIATTAAPTEAPPRTPRKEATKSPAPAAVLPESTHPTPQQPASQLQSGPYPRAGEQPVSQIAKHYVVDQGKRTGNEWTVAFDSQGNARLHQEGTVKNSGTPPEFYPTLLDKTADLVVHHNHPSSNTLSAADVIHLLFPGLRIIWAHGHDGTSSRAELTDYAREQLSDRRTGISKWEDTHWLYSILARYVDAARPMLQEMVNRREITPAEATRTQPLMFMAALDRANYIDWMTDIPVPTIWDREEVQLTIQRIAGDVSNAIFKAGNQLRGDGRRAVTFRTAEGIAGVLDRDGRPRGQRPAEGVLGRPGEGADRLPQGERGRGKVGSQPTPPQAATAPAGPFTKEAADAARERLKRKLGGLKEGEEDFDPEILQDGIALAGYHIQQGARSFDDFAGAMLADLGEVARPYLKSWYLGVRFDPRARGFTGMSGAAEVEAADISQYVVPTATEPTNDQQQILETDRAGVPPAAEEPGRGSQHGPAPEDTGDLGARQPADVGAAPEGAGQGELFGVGPASADVGKTGRAAEGRPARNRRPRAGGTRKPDAGAGERGPAGSARPEDGGREREAGEVPERGLVKEPETVSPGNPGPGDFHIDDPLRVVGGGQVARFEKNRAAIELRNQLIEDGRQPTREEQETLAGYTGWGSFGQELFQGSWERPRPKDGWEARDKWLRDNLGKSEWEGLQRSIINAHYTDPPTVLAMWDMVRRLGFPGGRVLEPSIGIGNFFGMMPADLAERSQRAGIELDPVTGSMAQLLYPNANIQIKGYEQSKTPDDFYDLVIGNWPFADFSPADRRYNRLNPLLHDYFFLKAVDQTRPGGLVVGITTKGTMDKKASTIRTELAKKAELVAAFRLPTGAFEEYAGTKVVTDILILRKRDQEKPNVAGEGWIKVADHPTPEGTAVAVNEYYHTHPDHVLGTINWGHGTTTMRPGLIVDRPADMMQALRDGVAKVPEQAWAPAEPRKRISYIANHTDDRTGSLVKTNDGFFVVQGEHLAPAQSVRSYAVKDKAALAKREDQLSRLIDMRQLYAALIDAERAGKGDAERKALRQAYEEFRKAHGPLGDSYGLNYLNRIDDPFFPALAALETNGKPAAILTESTMRGTRVSIVNPTIADAFVLARTENVSPTPERIAEIAKSRPDEVRRELTEKGAAFETPSGALVPADIYLSGNVREKRRQAQAALADGNTAMQRNVDALEKVVPQDIPYYQIETQMGATWVPPRAYADWIAHMLGLPNSDDIDVQFVGGEWKIDFPAVFNHRTEANSGFGVATREVSFKRLVRAAIGNQTISVRRKDSDGNWYIASEETKEANAKIADMRQKFGEWLWQDPVRRTELEQEYNESRNAYATPKFDGSFLPFQGMALSIGRGPFNLRQHQIDAIWRALVTRKSLNAHEVGTGKTFTMGGIAIESRRYGIAKKPMLLAHNANSMTVAAEIQQMYPGASILYVDNFNRENVKVRMLQIANDDWDLIVVPHSLIDRFGMREDTLMEMAQPELDALEAAAEEAAEEDGAKLTAEMLTDPEALKKLRSVTAKNLVKARFRVLERIKKMAQQASREDSVAFEDLGVDMVLIDEAHEFKKPPIATKMNMKGLQTQTSDRSIAAAFMTRYVRGQNNGGNVHLFTGTPITNTLTEVFHMMRYIMQEEMEKLSIADWDGWFGSFAREIDDIEMSSTGEFEPVTRLQSFINVPELRRMIGQYMDVVFSDDMPEMKPRKVNGKTLANKDLTEAERAQLMNGRTEGAQDRPYKQVINLSAEMTPEQLPIFEKVRALAQRWRMMGKKERKEAMARGAPEVPIIHDGIAEKASFDVRLVNAERNAGKEGTPEMEPHPDSKPARVVRNLLEIYRSHPQANQVVFMEQGMSRRLSRSEGEPGNKTSKSYPAFSTLYDMIERLVQAGVPLEEIAVVTGATSKQERKEIAEQMNRGEKRIVFGSTDSLGVGVNMQRNLRAMHHMDAPWMPGELEQRNGRGQRQGNQWNTVREYRYLTDRLDGRRWQVLAIKQRFITDFMKSRGDVRTIEGDAAADEQADVISTFAEAAGDPRVLLREKLKKKVEQLQSRERIHSQGRADALRAIRRGEQNVESLRGRLKALRESGAVEKARQLLDIQKGDTFRAQLFGKSFEKSTEASEFAKSEVPQRMRMGEDRQIGTYADVPLFASWHEADAEPHLHLTIGNQEVETEAPSMAGVLFSIRHIAMREAELEKNIAEQEATNRHLQGVADQPFHLADQLEDAKKKFAALQADIDKNPIAPPFWLRQGAPVDTKVLWNGKEFTVTGHRWDTKGYWVIAEDPAGEVAIPYRDVTDDQGMALYDEHEFSAPKLVEKQGDAAEPPTQPGEDKITYRAESGGWIATIYGVEGEIWRGSGKTKPEAVASARAKRDTGLSEPPQDDYQARLRTRGLPRDLKQVTWFRNTGPMRRHPDYAAAKGGDTQAAIRLASDDRIVTPGFVDRVRQAFGSSVVLAPVQAVDITGRNRIPVVLARRLEAELGARMTDDIVETNRAWHTGQDAINRMLRRAEFDGPVEPGARYVLVDDVNVFGSTLADLADHIIRGGGKVAGIVTLVDQSKRNNIQADEKTVRTLESQFGDTIRTGFGIEPAALTGPEAAYLARFGSADALRDRIAAARLQEGVGRGTAGFREEAPGSVTPAATRRGFAEEGDSASRRRQPELLAAQRKLPPSEQRELAKYPTHERILNDLKGKLTDLQPSLLAAVPLNYFTELKQPNMTAVDDYLKLKRAMDTYRGKKHEEMDGIAKKWRKLGKANVIALSELMHDATREGIDPANPDPGAANLPAFHDLTERFAKLAPQAKEIYREVRDAYKAIAKETDKLLLENVAKAQEIARRQAARAYKREVERIRASTKMSELEKSEALDRARQDYEAEMTRAQWSAKARISRLRLIFEQRKVAEPYFPLARYGRYLVSLKDADGEVVSFSRRERAADRDRLVRELRADPSQKGMTIETGVLDEKGWYRDAMDPRFVAQVEKILSDTGVQPEVMDMIWQRYLQSMPDLSLRKRYMHRKGTPGYHGDALRVFGNHMFHGAHQLGRLKYGLELQDTAGEAAEQARESDDTTKGTTLANELRKRNEWVLNPTGQNWVQWLTSLSFVWYLGATPAAAAVNLTQTPMLGIPILAGRFGGFAKATAALARASRNIAGDSGLSDEEKRAMQSFYDSGLIDRTQSHDLAGVGDVGVEYNPWRARAMALVSLLFHKAEIANRRVTALAAFRLARKAGQRFDEAIDTAHDITWRTHFDYSNSSRPRIAQNDFVKLAFTFKTHQLNMIYRMSRDFRQMMRGETPQARREARYQFAGILGMQALMAGVTGVFGYNAAMWTAGMTMAIFNAITGDDDDDPYDLDQRFRAAILDLLGPNWGGQVLNGVPGSYLGIDLTSRIGMADLWLRSPNKDLEGEDEYNYWLLQVLGAVPSLGKDVFRGIGYLTSGDLGRAIELATPKVIRDIGKSYKYFNEGVTTAYGDSVVDRDNLSSWDLVAQFLGFTPAKVAEAWDQNAALKTAESRVQKRRQTVINSYALSVRLGDVDGKKEALDRIKRFNRSDMGRTMPIKAETLARSMKMRAVNAKKRRGGVLIQNERLGKELRERLPQSVY